MPNHRVLTFSSALTIIPRNVYSLLILTTSYSLMMMMVVVRKRRRGQGGKDNSTDQSLPESSGSSSEPLPPVLPHSQTRHVCQNAGTLLLIQCHPPTPGRLSRSRSPGSRGILPHFPAALPHFFSLSSRHSLAVPSPTSQDSVLLRSPQTVLSPNPHTTGCLPLHILTSVLAQVRGARCPCPCPCPDRILPSRSLLTP